MGYFTNFESYRNSSFGKALEYRVVFVCGNRGVNAVWLRQLYSTNGWLYRGAVFGHRDFYSALFDMLFIPTQELLSMQVSLLDRGPMSARDLLDSLGNNSAAIHFRAKDGETCGAQDSFPSLSQRKMPLTEKCLQVVRGVISKPNSSVLILSNSECNARELFYQYYRRRYPSSRVYMILGNDNAQIDTRMHGGVDEQRENLKVSIRDLLLMRAAQTVVSQGGGFPAAASAISNARQVFYDGSFFPAMICSSRFC